MVDQSEIDAMTQRADAAFDCLEAVPNAIFVLQAKRILWANKAATELTGHDRVDLFMMDFADLFGASRLDDSSDHQKSHLITARGQTIHVEIEINSTEINGQQVEIATLNGTRSPRLPVVYGEDQVYRQAIEGSLDSFYLLYSLRDSSTKIVDFVFVDVNERGCKAVRLRREQIIGQNLCELMPINRANGFFDRYVRVVETGEVLDEDFTLPLPDGERLWLHHQVIRVDDGIAIFTRDITERKRTEAALLESQRRYRALLNQSNDCVSLLDLNGYYVLVNDQLASRLGYMAEEMTGMHLTEVIEPNQVEHFHRVDRELKDGQRVPLFERTYRRRDGTLFLGEVNISFVYDAEGNPLYVQSIMRDITERKQVERALRESEERYRIISELISDYAYAFRIEPDGKLVHEWITESFRRMTGFTHEEIDEDGQYALYHPDDEDRAEADVQRVLRGEAVAGEYRIITKSGVLRWVHIFRQPVWNAAEGRVTHMYGVAQDITERKQADEDLRKSEEKYRLIAENASDVISTSSSSGIRTYISSACRKLLGYDPEELIGQPSTDIIHPDDRPIMGRLVAVFQESFEPVTYTCRSRHKNGNYLWLEITTKPIFDPETNAIQEFISVARDVSHRKQMEAILLEQDRLIIELQKEQELSEVKSNLMRTISHEFRTPLTLIVTATEFLDTYIERLDVHQRQERLEAIRVQVKRLSEMLDDISFVVQGTLHHMTARPAQLDLEAYCRAILQEIETTMGQDHQFVLKSDGQLQQGIADKALLIRIVSNLLSNAVKYSPAHSEITLTLSRDHDDAVVQVSDHGIGITEEEQKRIFEPFYRSSSVIDRVGGTGLGLSIVKDCVDLHHGAISVTSEVGKGTTFTVRLPQTLELA